MPGLMLNTVDKNMTKIGSLFLRRENRHANRHSQFHGVSSTMKGYDSYCGNKKIESSYSARANIFTITGIRIPQIVSNPNVISYLFILGNSVGSICRERGSRQPNILSL